MSFHVSFELKPMVVSTIVPSDMSASYGGNTCVGASDAVICSPVAGRDKCTRSDDLNGKPASRTP